MPRMIDVKPKVGLMVDIKPKMGDMVDIKPKIGNFWVTRGRTYDRTLVAGQLMMLVPLITYPSAITVQFENSGG